MAIPADAQAYFDKQPGDMKAIAEALSARIETLGPELTCKLAWGYPCWSGNERIFSVIAHKARCNLQLFYGAALADTSNRIEGTGKALRHVKVGDVSEIDGEIDDIIKAAIALDTADPQKVR